MMKTLRQLPIEFARGALFALAFVGFVVHRAGVVLTLPYIGLEARRKPGPTVVAVVMCDASEIAAALKVAREPTAIDAHLMN